MNIRNYDWDFVNTWPAKCRLNFFLEDILASENEDEQLTREMQLAKRLGVHVSVVQAFSNQIGMKVDWRYLPMVADYLKIDPARLLCLWVSQHTSEKEIYEAAKRCVTRKELALVRRHRKKGASKDELD